MALALASGEWTPTPEHLLAVPAFKTPALEAQWPVLHPKLRVVLQLVDDWLFENGMERITVTDLLRTPADQERIYTPVFMGQGIPKDKAAQLARHRFSWHLVGSAADFRHSVKPYTQAEVDRINMKLQDLCPPSAWELLHHSVGLGMHFHVAIRQKPPPKEGAV